MSGLAKALAAINVALTYADGSDFPEAADEARDLRAARDAFAGLIDAAKAEVGQLEGRSVRVSMDDRAKRLRAALARCGATP